MNFLAFDLGAESGRGILGQLHAGILSIREIYCFPNDPVRYGGQLHWDILRPWHEMNRALESSSLPKLESIGVGTWGVDYALLGERGNLLENPDHYRNACTGNNTRRLPVTGLLLWVASAVIAGYAGSL